ncbi:MULTISPECIES: hypothetical protein [unclassified Streptomyces]|uniref:hypothetical protein n=1 Tax=Streptomyces sp. NPDC055082 TaxID=3365718 RepID=UPI0037CCCB45
MESAEAALGFGEDDLGQGAGAGVLVQDVGTVADIGGDGAGAAGQPQGDLLEVVRGEGGRVGPGQDRGARTLVGGAVQGQFRPE